MGQKWCGCMKENGQQCLHPDKDSAVRCPTRQGILEKYNEAVAAAVSKVEEPLKMAEALIEEQKKAIATMNADNQAIVATVAELNKKLGEAEKRVVDMAAELTALKEVRAATIEQLAVTAAPAFVEEKKSE